MSFQARIWNQQQLGYVIHTSVDKEGWQLYSKGNTSSAGNAGGTTAIDVQRAEADNYFNGEYWFVQTSGTNAGQSKRIVDFSQGTNTFTFENNGFPAQVASGVEYEIWKSPEPVILVTSAASSTVFTDNTRTEATGHWVGYYVCPISLAGDRGKISVITASTSGGQFTVSPALSGTPTAGDVMLIRKFVEASDINFGGTQAFIQRPMNRVNFGIGDGVIGPKAGTISFTTQITPSNGTPAASTRAQLSAVGHLLVAAGLEETVCTGIAVGAGSSTTAVKITTGSWENFAIGAMVVINNECAWITGMTDGGGAVDTLTVTPALSSAPTAGDLVIPTRMYAKSTSGDLYGVTLEWEVDGVRNTATGCKGSVTLTSGAAPTLAFNYNIDHWIREIEAAPYIATSAYTDAIPVLEQDRIAYLSTTKTNISGFTATPGTTVAPRGVQGAYGLNGRVGFQVTGYACGGTWQELMDNTGDIDQEIKWLARTSKDLIVVMGASSDYAGVRIPVARHIELPAPSNADGLVAVPCVYAAQDASSTTDGGGTVVKIPDFAICLT